MNYGVLFTAWGTAGIISPVIAGRVYDAFGDYRYAFFGTAGLALVALASLSMARPPGRQMVTKTSSKAGVGASEASLRL